MGTASSSSRFTDHVLVSLHNDYTWASALVDNADVAFHVGAVYSGTHGWIAVITFNITCTDDDRDMRCHSPQPILDNLEQKVEY